MTTIVTVKTGHCPAAAHVSSSTTGEREQHYANSTYFIEAGGTRDFTISTGGNVAVYELAEGATSLVQPCAPGGVTANG